MLGESPAETAHRHFREQYNLILRQKEIIEMLALAGESTGLAEDVLETMQRTLDITIKELRRFR